MRNATRVACKSLICKLALAIQIFATFAIRYVLIRWRLCVILLLAIIAIHEAAWLPIYPDEVAIRISLERYFLNGGYKQSVWAACSNFLVPPPVSLIPAFMTWSLLDNLGIGFWSYRLVPIVCMALIAAIVVRLRQNDKPLVFLLAGTFGPVLYGIVILRSEVFILTGFCDLLLSFKSINGHEITMAKVLMALSCCFPSFPL